MKPPRANKTLINLKGNIDFLAGEKIPTGQTSPEKNAVLR
jgi:hypothetical protein